MPALLALVLLGCARGPAPVAAADAPAPDAPSLDAFFDATWQAHLDDTPVMRTFLGIGDDHSTWGDLSDQGALDRIAKAEANCTTLRNTFDPATLAPDEALSYRLFLHDCEGQISDRPWVQHNYPVNPIGGQHTWFATFLMGVQPLTEPDDIDDWIARLADVDTQLDVLIQQLKDREALGVMPPAFAFGHPSSSSRWVPWARLLKLAFGQDAWACPRCGEPMELRCILRGPRVINKVLHDLSKSSRGPPRPPAVFT